MLISSFDADDVRIESVDPPGPAHRAHLDELATKHGLPYIRPFFEQIEGAQGDQNERFGRRYQREVLASGALGLISPLTGKRAVAIQSIAVNGKIFFCFADRDRSGEEIDYFVISSRPRFGFPLAGLFVPKRNLLVTWEPGGRRAIGRPHLEALAQAAALRTPIPLPVPRVVILGHTNFAHHLWNELSALETLVSSGPLDAGISFHVARETLGSIADMFPELQGHPFRRVGDEAPLGGVRTGGLFVSLGALCIPQSMRQRIAAFSRRKASAEARTIIAAIEKAGGPMFWISVRTLNPTLANQREVLATIVVQLLNEYERCSVVFDGFSLPEDWDRTCAEMKNSCVRAVWETRLASEAILADVCSRVELRATQFVTSIAGTGLLDSIAIAQSAAAYLCHTGSIQHKIGWTANVPGIIHGNRRVPSGDLGRWHASRLQDGIVPVVPPAEFFRDAATGEREENYIAVDPNAFARFVSDNFRRFGRYPCQYADT